MLGDLDTLRRTAKGEINFMFKKTRQNFNVAFFAMAIATFVFSSFPNGAAAPDAERNSLALEEIVVTVRKKSESIQDVPLAVTAITDQLREGSGRRLEDIQAFAPNLFINRMPGIASGAAITIGHGRKADHSAPPVQIRTCATNAYGSYLEYLA
jgi:hypothetical protein